jgi:hypothetical protein
MAQCTHENELTNHARGPWFVHTWQEVLAILVGCRPMRNPSSHAPHSKSPMFQHELEELRQELDPNLSIPHLADETLPGSPPMYQGWQCVRIGKNTQILALISGHRHQGCQSKLQQQEVHLVGMDINILMEN